MAVPQFIHKYSKITLPMTALLEGKQTFRWTEAAQVAFEALMKTFAEAPLLVHFNPTLKIWLECNSSVDTMAVIILQRQEHRHLHPIAFYSKKFIQAEVSYSTLTKNSWQS